MNNTLYLKRRNNIFITPKRSRLESIYISALLKNLESLGYTLSAEIVEILKTYSIQEIEEFYNEIVGDLKKLIGADVEYKPMYPNFPKQVMEASEGELYTNAWLHYLGDAIGVRILPKSRKRRRARLKDKIKLRIIELGNINDFNIIFTRLAGSKTSLSETDKEDIKWFIQTYKNDIQPLLPLEIPLKENGAFIAAMLTNYTDISELFLKNHLKTATDTLRFITALSEGDISLAENTRFKNFKKKERLLILSALEKCSSVTEDMLRYKEKWKRVGERLHPFEYKTQFPKSFEAFDTIRNNKPFETFNSRIESSLVKKDIKVLVEDLKQRPGEFARRLDHLLRISTDDEDILAGFSQVADKVSSPVLLQVLTHFKHRNQNHDLRVFFPKGDVSKVQAVKNDLEQIDELIRQKAVSICKEALISKYKKLKPLGKVYLDKNLKKYTVPFALRSASKALKTISRGSKLDIPSGNTLRFFIWWKDGSRRADIDLSAIGLDKNHIFKTAIAYFNLKVLGGYHSGDITSAPDGASEFIDINIDHFLELGIKYLVISLNSYTQQPFCDLPECSAGFMVREKPGSGEIYEPQTIENKFDIGANTKICIPLIVDLEDRKAIWTDISLSYNIRHSNNVYNNMSSITLMSKAMTSLIKPTLYELFELHIQARGEKVERKKDADTVFSEKDGVTPLDTEQIIAEFL